MNGFDILIDKKIEAKKLQDDISNLFGFESKNVLVCDSVAKIILARLIHLLVVSTKVSGEFVLLLALYFQKSYVSKLDQIEIAKRLCIRLECQCLISDNEINPYSMIRVDTEGCVQKKNLSVDSLDNEDKYIVE